MKFVNHGMNGEFQGYTRFRSRQPFFCWIFPLRTIYRITISKINPLYFVDDKGRKLTPHREYESDLASIPWPFDRLWSPQQLELSGIIHDAACRFGGLWQILNDGSQVFVPMVRLEADQLIEKMAQVECRMLGKGKVYQAITKHCIFWGVRIGSKLGLGVVHGDMALVEPTNKIDPKLPPIAFA
jgi:hypothetical protein